MGSLQRRGATHPGQFRHNNYGKIRQISAQKCLTKRQAYSIIISVKKSPVCAGELVTLAKRVHPFPSRTR
jgi:hypothetical protein